MKRTERIWVAYEAPVVEVIEVEVEKGFALSVNVTGNSWEQGDGSNLETE